MMFSKIAGKVALVLLALILSGVSGCGRGQAPASPQAGGEKAKAQENKSYATADELYADLAKLPPEERQQRLVEGAKKEGGNLSLYAVMDEPPLQEIIKNMKKKYPFINVQYVSGSAQDLGPKVRAELRAGKYMTDVLDLADELYAINKEFPFAKHYGIPVPKNIPKYGYSDYWIAVYTSPMVITWNTKLVPPGEAPKNWEDLTNPKWKKQIAIDTDPTKEIAAMLERWGEEKTRDYFKKVALDNQGLIRKGYSAKLESLVAGEFPVALTLYLYKVLQLQKKAAPIEWINPDPTGAALNTAGIVNKAPHPYTAMLFLQELTSKETGEVVERKGYMPVNPDAKLTTFPAMGRMLTEQAQKQILPSDPDFTAKWSVKREQIRKDIIEPLFIK